MTATDLAELARDIRSLDPSIGSGALNAERWMTQPAISRRIAAAMARAIPAGTERIVASGDSAELLGMAVALACGLPVAIVTEEGRVIGDRHPGEATFSVALTDAVVDDGGELVGDDSRPALDLVLIGALGLAPRVFRAGPPGLVADAIERPTSEER